MHRIFWGSEGLQGTHMDAFSSKLMTVTIRGGFEPFRNCALQDGKFVLIQIYQRMTAQFGNFECCVIFWLVERMVHRRMKFPSHCCTLLSWIAKKTPKWSCLKKSFNSPRCTYLNDVLQKGLIGRHFGLFHHGYVLPHPGDEHKFGTFTHFITSLKEKRASLIIWKTVYILGQ